MRVVLLLMVLVVVGGMAVPAQAAPGCDSAQPTFLGGTIHGWPDDRALNALIGVDMKDSAGQQIDADGRLRGDPNGTFCGGYSWCDRVNPGIPPEGSTDPTLDRSWGRCVHAAAVQTFIEVYPKNELDTTTKTRYGAAAHYFQPVTPGGTNTVGLRLPVTFEADNGNTGGVHGYLTYLGHRIPPDQITRVRAFTHGRGPECGVEGFSAAADELGYSSTLDATWYEIGFLAAGRCGATSQTYTLYVDCVCGGVKRTLSRIVPIEKGRYPRVDLAFP